MDWVSALVLMLGMICAFMALGLPVAFAFLLANIAGALIFLGGAAGLVSLAVPIAAVHHSTSRPSSRYSSRHAADAARASSARPCIA